MAIGHKAVPTQPALPKKAAPSLQAQAKRKWAEVARPTPSAPGAPPPPPPPLHVVVAAQEAGGTFWQGVTAGLQLATGMNAPAAIGAQTGAPSVAEGV